MLNKNYFSLFILSTFTTFVMITIGSDFEFEVYDKIRDEIISAKYLIKNLNGKIGLDGDTSIGEVRPDYSYDVNIFFGNIVNTLIELRNIIKSKLYEIVFDSIKHPTGFHIHLGIEVDKELHKSLSSFLTSVLYEVLYKYNGPARVESKYSKKYNIRFKYYGVEYREAPSSILNDPEYARILLKLVKNLAKIFFSYDIVVMRQKGDEFEEDSVFTNGLGIIEGEEIDTTLYIRLNSDGIPTLSLNERLYKHIIKFNQYELSILDRLLNDNYDSIRSKTSCILEGLEDKNGLFKFYGSWNNLKKYIIYNLFEKFVDKEEKEKKGETLVFTKTINNAKSRYNKDKKEHRIYLGKEFAETYKSNWENDVDNWIYLLDTMFDKLPMNSSRGYVMDYLASFYS